MQRVLGLAFVHAAQGFSGRAFGLPENDALRELASMSNIFIRSLGDLGAFLGGPGGETGRPAGGDGKA